VMPPQKFIHST